MSKLVTKTVIETIGYSANDWELYGKDGREAVAVQLNDGIKNIINAGNDREATRRLIDPLLNRFADFGAADTEGRDMVERILNKVFGAQ